MICEAILAVNAKEREKLNRQFKALGIYPQRIAVSVGQHLAGHRLSVVWASYDTMLYIRTCDKASEWFRDGVVTRLTPEGQIIELP